MRALVSVQTRLFRYWKNQESNLFRGIVRTIMVRIQSTKIANNNNNNRTILLMIVALPTTALIASWALGSWLPFSELPRTTAVKNDPLLVVQPPACEGYWPETDVCVKLGKNPSKGLLTEENAACPQWRIRKSSWTNQEEVTSKLGAIEAVAKEWETLLQDMTPDQLTRAGGVEGVTPPVFISRQRGLAWSRIEEGVMAGNAEYHTGGDNDVCWTDAMLPLYMDKYNVEPSEKFQQFVRNFDVDGFRDSLAKLKARMGPS